MRIVIRQLVVYVLSGVFVSLFNFNEPEAWQEF